MLAASKESRSITVTNANDLDEVDQYAVEAAIEAIGHPDIETIEDLLAGSVDGKITLIETIEPTTGEEVTVVFANLKGNGVHGAVLADDSSAVRASISEGVLVAR